MGTKRCAHTKQQAKRMKQFNNYGNPLAGALNYLTVQLPSVELSQ